MSKGGVGEAARALLPLHLTKLARRLSREQALRRAELLIERSGLFPAVEAVLHHQVGKPREFTARALLTGLAVHALLLEEMHLTRVLDTLAELPLAARRKLGLTSRASYRMLWHAYTLLIRALDTDTLITPHNHPSQQARSPGLNERVPPCPDGCPYEPISLSEFVGRLLDASLPGGFPLTGVIAIDSTDYETWARRRAWSPEPDIAPDHVPVPVPAEDTPLPRRKRPPNEPGWPCTGADGRLMHTVDPDSREGYRSGTNASPGNVFCGFDLHLAVNARTLGARAPEVPFVFTAMHLAAAGSHKGDAGITLIDQHLARHPHTSEVIADRGYSYCTPAQWAHPVRARGLEPVIDLHPKQRGIHPGPLAGTVIIDGTLFTDALPHPLRDLPGFPIGMRSAEKAKLRTCYDQRAAYAFTPHSRPDTDGYQRFKGPALAGHLRCPNHPASLRLPHTRPTSTCRPGTPCACGKTVTLSPDVMAWTRQRTIWGTTAWAADYGRRAAAESGNAEIKTHRLHMDRGFTRVFGTTKNSVLIAFALAGLNHTLLRAWHTKRQLPDPWATFTGEETIEPAAPGPRTRARRRATSLTALIDGAPPG
ncbi:hypothetical protein ACFRKB_01010 [Streptomyces scopuliridis]|uniref:hypothetical protein n=1 Tax=Streptomyces scopuliridis TaxID=452529 RepID=UPI0036B9FE6E